MRYYEVAISAESLIFNPAKDGQISYLKQFLYAIYGLGIGTNILLATTVCISLNTPFRLPGALRLGTC